MAKWLMFPLVAATAMALPLVAQETTMAAAEVPPARDGNIAIEQELCAARKAATREAYDLFIARHPQHPLADVAREERARLAPAKR